MKIIEILSHAISIAFVCTVFYHLVKKNLEDRRRKKEGIILFKFQYAGPLFYYAKNYNAAKDQFNTQKGRIKTELKKHLQQGKKK